MSDKATKKRRTITAVRRLKIVKAAAIDHGYTDDGNDTMLVSDLIEKLRDAAIDEVERK